jgi:hypothetical protein
VKKIFNHFTKMPRQERYFIFVTLRIPDKPYTPIEEQTRSIAAVAARWHVPSWMVKARLEEEGVPVIRVLQPTLGVRLIDLIALEEKLRAEKEPEVTEVLIKDAIPGHWSAAQIMAGHRNNELTNQRAQTKRRHTSEASREKEEGAKDR